MKSVVIGAHLLRDDVEPLATAVPAGDLYLSAVAVPDDQSLGDRELLVRVAGIRAQLLDTATFVAIRYGFTISAPEEAHAKCSAHLARWRRLLEENRTNVEMTLKTLATSPRPRPDRRDFSSGAEYLRALHGAKQAATPDPQFRDAAERLIAPLSVRQRWLHRDEKSVELAALVARDRLDDVRRAGEELRAAAPDVPFLLSGPWPLEVFADDDHE